MKDYFITTEKTCDLPIQVLNTNNIETVCMRYTINETEYNDNDELSSKEFCDYLRQGANVMTSAVNMYDAEMFFKKMLEKGKNVLHIAFSSGLSSSCKNLQIVAENLNKEYENKIYVLDSICGSVGQGILCEIAIQKANEGMSFDNLINFLEDLKYKICHIFTVDDLKHLLKGGRISKTKEKIGSLLHIKPVLYLDNEGRIVQSKNVISRKKAIMTLCEDFAKTFTNEYPQIYIGHSDCMEDALLLQNLIKRKTGYDSQIFDICKVITTHGGPGSLALFYVGSKRI
ncbi:MAG: DegV family protein [Clostridia bacterium]|nr:DegV family protein [Clostridia bacterium]